MQVRRGKNPRVARKGGRDIPIRRYATNWKPKGGEKNLANVLQIRLSQDRVRASWMTGSGISGSQSKRERISCWHFTVHKKSRKPARKSRRTGGKSQRKKRPSIHKKGARLHTARYAH